MELTGDLDLNLGEEFVDLKKKRLKYITIISVLIIIVIILIAIILVLLLSKKDKSNENNNNDDSKKSFTILLNDSQIHKPFSSTFNSEIIKLKNGLQAILINEKNTTGSSFAIQTNFGGSLDIIPGLAHFAEHMFCRGGKKFRENSFWKGMNYAGIINDAFTTMETTTFYFFSTISNEFENFLDIASNSLKDPDLNPEKFKNEINVVNSEFFSGNISEDYLVSIILYSLSNENHPLHNSFYFGNNITLNSISSSEMEKYLKAYFQQAYNPKNLVVVLRSYKNLTELENLAVKYFNYEINVTETIGNQKRDEIRDKIKNEKLFNKNDGAKFIKIFSKVSYNLNLDYNSTELFNILIFSFAVNNLTYKDGFNPVDFINFLFSDSKSSLSEYLLSKNYSLSITNKIFKQFFDMEQGFFHIYLTVTENGLNYIEEIIKAIFHYINLIKNNIDELEKDLFPNYQKYKLNQFNYRYNEIEDYNSWNREIFLNMRKHGMKSIFKNDVPDKFDKNLFLKFLEDTMDIENSIISLLSNCKNEKIKLLDNYTTNYINYYGNEYNISSLNDEFIQTLKKFPVDENLTNFIKLRNINKYFTNIEKNEYNPLIDKSYNVSRCDLNDTTYFCYYAKDRSLNIPKVKIVLKIKSKFDEILTPDTRIFFNAFYIMQLIGNYFEDFLLDTNNKFTSTYENEEFIIDIETYKDVALNFFEKLINKLLTFCDVKEFNNVIKLIQQNIFASIGFSKLNIENMNDVKFDLFEYGATDKDPYSGYNNMEILKSFNYNTIKIIHSSFVNSFIEYAKLFLIGDLDENLILELSKIVKEKININNNNELNNQFQSFIFKNDIIQDNFIPEFNDKNLFFNSKNIFHISNQFLNKYSNSFIDNKIIPDNTIINYVYSNDNIYEKESYTLLLYKVKNIPQQYLSLVDIFLYSIMEKIFTELRTNRALGYHCFPQYKRSIAGSLYLSFYVKGSMKTPIQIQDDINLVLNEILNSWEPEDFKSIYDGYYNYYLSENNKNTFSKRVNAFIGGIKGENIKNMNINDEFTFKQIVQIVKTIFESPIRIGIFEYANYIDGEFIKKEIEERNEEVYFFNNSLKVNYTQNINFFQ